MLYLQEHLGPRRCDCGGPRYARMGQLLAGNVGGRVGASWPTARQRNSLARKFDTGFGQSRNSTYNRRRFAVFRVQRAVVDLI